MAPNETTFIFDLDGTLADTSAVWYRAESTLYAALGQSWAEEIFPHYVGMKADDVAAVIHRFLQPALSVAECQKILRNALLEAYEHVEIREIPGARALVRRLEGTGPMAVASGSPARGIHTALERLGIAECFDLVMSTEEVARGKPHPDAFLATADRLGVAPSTCVVFEDSRVGAEAALASGMRVFVRPTHSDLTLLPAGAIVVERWDDVEIRG